MEKVTPGQLVILENRQIDDHVALAGENLGQLHIDAEPNATGCSS